jgi:hypothetical protein
MYPGNRPLDPSYSANVQAARRIGCREARHDTTFERLQACFKFSGPKATTLRIYAERAPDERAVSDSVHRLCSCAEKAFVARDSEGETSKDFSMNHNGDRYEFGNSQAP